MKEVFPIETSNAPLLQMRKINKSFPGVHALKDIDFELRPGEVCGLLGENGAGKSTLMNVLGGVIPCDCGTILLEGKPVEIKTTKIAESLGISFIHQELSLFPNMDIATNIFVQNLPKNKLGFLNKRKLKRETREVLRQVHLEHCHPDQKISSLKIGEQQLVEIGRALAQYTKVLILDEPTSSLTSSEIKVLFSIVRDLKQKGVAIIFITHRMDEIFEICDTLMVMRDGERVLKSRIGETSRADIITAMLGRNMQEQYHHDSYSIGKELLCVKGLCRRNKLSNVSFTLHEGELLGIYGLLGSGRSELLRSIFGLDAFDSGQIYLYGEPVRIDSPKAAIDRGIGMVTEDRHKEGLVLGRSVSFNLTLANLKAIKGRVFTNPKKEAEIGERNIRELNIKTPSAKRVVQFLSGGNQQKVVVSKWLNTKPRLLLMDEPTRGIDIGAKREMYSIIESLLREGVGVIMVSSELPELIGLCDHVIVLKEGRIAAEISDPNEISSKRLLEAAMGG